MKKMYKYSNQILIVLFAFLALSFDLPDHWFKAGSEPKSYDMGIDPGAGFDGKNAATIKSREKKINGFGTLMQECQPDKFLGKRVRMSAYMKTSDVDGWAGLWFRVDESHSDKPLSFDNMGNRSLKGSNEWKKYEIVLDVPLNASNLAYGALLTGTGQVWFDKLNFEIVDETIPTTDKGKNFMPNKEPLNTDFEISK